MQKIVFSILFGLFCFFGSFGSLRFDFTEHKVICFVWSLIFPLLINLAWGKKYGIISLSLGIGGFYMFFLSPNNGMGNIAICISTYLFIMTQNINYKPTKLKMPKLTKVYLNVEYFFVHLIIYFVIYPLLIYINRYMSIDGIISSISIQLLVLNCFNQYINYLLILIICDVLLLLPPIRQLFGLSTDKYSKYNVLIITFSLVIGWVITFLIIYAIRYLNNNEMLFPNRNYWLLILLLSVIFCLIGDVFIRLVQKNISNTGKAKRRYMQYNNILETISDIYFEILFDGTIIEISPSIESCLGYYYESLIGNNFFKILFYPEQMENVLNVMLKDCEVNNFEVIMRDKMGQRHVFWVNSKLTVNNLDQNCMIGTMKDMTWYIDIHQMYLENEKIYKNIFDKLIIAFIILKPIFDKQGNIIDFLIINANPAMFEQVGILNKKKFVGKLWSDAFSHNDVNYYKCIESYTTDEPVVYEYYDSKKSKYFHVKAFKINEFSIGLFFENITSYKKTLQQLKILNIELEKRVLERTDELQNAVNELEVFSHTISHDLKSPLRAIDVYQSIILEDYIDNIPEEMVDIVNSVRSICEDTISMINKLLQFAATSNAKLFKEPVSLEDLFKDVFEKLMASNPDRKIDFIIKHTLPTVIADKILLKQVIENILSNAIKFTRTKEYAIIKIYAVIKDNKHLICVKDNGVGFDMAYSNKLFGIFERLHTSQEYEGSGIGLAIISKIIQKHRGNVSIVGHKDKGTSICFTLPIIGSEGEEDV